MELFNHTPVQVAASGEREADNLKLARRPTVIPSQYDVKQRLGEMIRGS
jgi:hypothetical protein